MSNIDDSEIRAAKRLGVSPELVNMVARGYWRYIKHSMVNYMETCGRIKFDSFFNVTLNRGEIVRRISKRERSNEDLENLIELLRRSFKKRAYTRQDTIEYVNRRSYILNKLKQNKKYGKRKSK